MTNLLLIVLIVLVIYDIILTVQIDNLRTDMSNVKKFIYNQFNLNVERADMDSKFLSIVTDLPDRLINLHNRVKKLEEENRYGNIDYDPDLLNKRGDAV